MTEEKTMVAALTKNGKEEFYPGYVSLESLEKWPFELKEIRKLYFSELKDIMLEDSRDIKGVAVIPFREVILLDNEIEL